MNGTKAIAAALVVSASVSAKTADALETPDSVASMGNPDAPRLYNLGEVVVTGSRTGGSGRIYPGADDRAEPRRDVAHAAAELPGVALSNVGARNELQLWVRGFDSRQTGLYLDGAPIYVPYDGNVDLARFSSTGIASITIEKGASSLALGPNSMGAAVNLVTKAPARPLELSAETGLLGRNGQQGSLHVASSAGSWWGLASGSFSRTGGYELPAGFQPTRYENGIVRDNSASFDRTIHGKVGWVGESGSQATFSVTDQNGTKNVPVYAGSDTSSSRYRFWTWPYWDKRSLGVLSRFSLAEGAWIELPLYLDQFRNSLHAYDDASYKTQKKRSSFRSSYDDWTAGGSARLGLAWKGDTTKVFVHFKDDNHRETNTTNDTARSATTSVFLDKPDLRFEDRTWSAGTEAVVALPLNLSFAPGFAWTWRKTERADNLLNPSGYNYGVESFPLTDAYMWDAQGTLRWKPSSRHALHLSVSSRAHLPTIKDRYSYKLGQAIPNPDLGAERATQLEIGYRGAPASWMNLEACVWEAWISDAIVTATKVGPKGESQSRNNGSVRSGGPEWLGDASSDFVLPAPELAAKLSLPSAVRGFARLQARISWSYLLRRDTDNPGFRFVDQPRHKFNASILWSPVVPMDLVASTEASSSRPATSSGTLLEADGYFKADLLARWNAGRIVMEAGLQNAFDVDYSLSEGYPEPGRTGFARIKWSLH